MHRATRVLARTFSEPEHLARWWGPNGFTSTFQTFELRPGGHWRFVMHGPDGADYPNENVFIEVVAPEQRWYSITSPRTPLLADDHLHASGNKTLVGWRQVFDTAAHKERIAGVVAEGQRAESDPPCQ